jgi:hypothetical protein
MWLGGSARTVFVGVLSLTLQSTLVADALSSSTGNQAQQEPKSLGYIDELIETILERTDGPEVVDRHIEERTKFSRDRKLIELMEGNNLAFDAVGTKPEWEKNLITIRIPLRKGLQGFRLFFINERDQAALEKVESLEDLQGFPTGSGAQWSTTPLLEAAGFNVVRGESKSNLMDMLAAKRFSTFGRGVDEIFKEYEKWSSTYPDLAIEQSVALFIPHPTYIFVSPKRTDLAERFEKGLREMIADGSFDALFLKHFQDDIERAGLNDRKVFQIANPRLSKETPLDQDQLWFMPSEKSKNKTN